MAKIQAQGALLAITAEINMNKAASSELLSGLEREVGTKILEFGVDIFPVLFTTSLSCFLLLVVFCVRRGTVSQVFYNLSFFAQKLKASPDLTEHDSLPSTAPVSPPNIFLLPSNSEI